MDSSAQRSPTAASKLAADRAWGQGPKRPSIDSWRANQVCTGVRGQVALGGRQGEKSTGWPPSQSEGAQEGRSLDNPNVYFNEVGLAELLLERTGPLRLFFEKLGKPLQNKLAGFG